MTQEIAFSYEGKLYEVALVPNLELFHPDYQQLVVDQNGLFFTQRGCYTRVTVCGLWWCGVGEVVRRSPRSSIDTACYYQGTVKNSANSRAIMSNCMQSGGSGSGQPASRLSFSGHVEAHGQQLFVEPARAFAAARKLSSEQCMRVGVVLHV